MTSISAPARIKAATTPTAETRDCLSLVPEETCEGNHTLDAAMEAPITIAGDHPAPVTLTTKTAIAPNTTNPDAATTTDTLRPARSASSFKRMPARKNSPVSPISRANTRIRSPVSPASSCSRKWLGASNAPIVTTASAMPMPVCSGSPLRRATCPPSSIKRAAIINVVRSTACIIISPQLNCDRRFRSRRLLLTDIEVPSPDLIDGRVDSQFEDERGEDAADHRRGNTLHHIPAAAR